MAIQADVLAREARSKKYGISVRTDDGHINKPAEFSDIDDANWGDPVNWAYPVNNPEQARAAVAYFGRRRNQDKYSEADRTAIEARIKTLAEAQGVTVAAFNIEPSDNDRRQAVATALKIPDWYIQDMYPDRAIHRLPKTGTTTGYPDSDDGKLYMTPYTMIDGNVDLGERQEVSKLTLYKPVVKMTAEFTADASTPAAADIIPYIGKVFEIGDYPDKHFTLTEAEADAAIAAFSPVQNDYEHHNGLFDGKLGTLKRVWRDGLNLMGEMLVPKQVRELAGATIKTSLTWARDSKQIIGNALTSTPRVSDATLVAAFSAATVPPKKESKTMTLWEKLKAAITGDKALTDDEIKATFAEVLPTAAPPTAPVTAPPPATFASTTEDCVVCDGSGKVPKGKQGTKFKEPPAKMTEDPALTGIKNRQLTAEAEALFTGAVSQGKLLPAQHDAFVVTFTSLHKGDNGGAVTFSNDGTLTEGDGLKAFKLFVAGMPDNPALFAELLQTEAAKGNVLTFASGGGNGQPSDARMKQLKGYAGLK
jgi:hypothetical protein